MGIGKTPNSSIRKPQTNGLQFVVIAFKSKYLDTLTVLTILLVVDMNTSLIKYRKWKQTSISN